MILKQLTNNKNSRAILFFAGWGMDCHPFETLRISGYDLWIVYDYTDLTTSFDTLDRYREIVLIGWSYGVAMAAVALENTTLPVTRRVAINGTLHPVDNQLGIPESIFAGTLATLSAGTLKKFNRRMTGSASRLAEYEATAPTRSIESLRAELETIAAVSSRGIPTSPRWDEAVIASGDLIIPTAAQQKAWDIDRALCITEIEGPHLPDFDSLLPRLIVDKQLVEARFTSSAMTYDADAHVQQYIAQKLAGLCIPELAEGAKVYEFGVGTGILTRLLAASPRVSSITAVDIADIMKPIETSTPITRIIADAETNISEIGHGRYDAILSASAIQWFNSPRRFIEQAVDRLPLGGIIAFSTYGDKNFTELDSLLPSRRHYPSLEQWKGMLPPSVEILSAGEEIISNRFDSPLDILRHIKNTGVNATGDNLSPIRFLREYPSENTLTFNPVWIIGRKINKSQ